MIPVITNFNRNEGMFIDESQTFVIPISMHGDIFTFMIKEEVLKSANATEAIAEAHAATRSMRSKEIAEEEEIVAKPASAAESSIATSPIPASSMRAHVMYGHLCGRKLDQLIENNAADGLSIQQKHPSHKLLIANCAA